MRSTLRSRRRPEGPGAARGRLTALQQRPSAPARLSFSDPLPARTWNLALLLGVSIACCGCGYSVGFKAPRDVRSISVPIFQNETFPLRREVEYDLTRAIREEIQTRSDLRLVDDEAADMAVYGSITSFRERLVAEGRVDEKIESSIVVEVSLIVEDYLARRQRKIPRVQVTEPLSVQIGETVDEARRRAIGNLAEKIVEQLESWEE